jgi:transcriptional regulator with XRE-family HTH domain
MEITPDNDTDRLLARRLKELRNERGWSLDDLATRSGVSRATLSRLENADVSPTASVLGKLCAVFGMPMSRLMRMVEESFAPLISRTEQPVWTDPETGYVRRSVSPPVSQLAGEVIESTLPPSSHIHYDGTPRPGMEHHLVLIDGALEIAVSGQTHRLQVGDCLRYQLTGPSTFSTPNEAGAKYLLFMI